MKTSDFDFELPEDLIAQHPVANRSDSRLLCFFRPNGILEHHHFVELPSLLRAGDLLVLNDTKVIPARLSAQRDTGKKFEILLMEPITSSTWKAMVRPGKDAAKGIPLTLLNHVDQPTDVMAVVYEKESEGGVYHVRFSSSGQEVDIPPRLADFGSVPLPPYIERAPVSEDVQRYQTVYAHFPGSVAAPTAGLHFTEALLKQLKEKNIQIAKVTLHVGPGTFAPVKTENIAEHPMHEERFIFNEETAEAIRVAKKEKRRVIPVGTTSMRVLESVAREEKIFTMEDIDNLHSIQSRTRLFIYPPAPFYLSDAMITNFHFPKSTLLMLVSAFAAPGETRGCDLMLSAYREAVKERYRFFSYGDAMLIQ